MSETCHGFFFRLWVQCSVVLCYPQYFFPPPQHLVLLSLINCKFHHSCFRIKLKFLSSVKRYFLPRMFRNFLVHLLTFSGIAFLNIDFPPKSPDMSTKLQPTFQLVFGFLTFQFNIHWKPLKMFKMKDVSDINSWTSAIFICLRKREKLAFW